MSVSALLTDNSLKDGTGDAINGAEVDANPEAIANVLDGTTAEALGSAGGLSITGTYDKPLTLGTVRIWHDATNGFLRAKVGSNPSSETDGNILMWGA